MHGNGLTVLDRINYAVAFGQFNEGNNKNYIFEVGMGKSDTQRKSAFAIAENGDMLIYNRSKKALYSLHSLLNALGAYDKVNPSKEYDF